MTYTALTLAALLLGTPDVALAGPGDLATKWPINDDDPKAFIPSIEDRNADPLEFAYYLQDLVFRAEGAYRKQDWQGTVKYYGALAAAVPDKATSHSRMCDAYARLGKIEDALDSCRACLRLQGAKVIDHLRFLDLMLRKPSFDAVDADDVEASLAHLREHARLHPQALPGEKALAASAGPSTPEAAAAKQAETDDPQAQLKAKVRELLDDQKGEPEPEAEAGALHLPTQIEFASCRLAVRIGDATRLAECMSRLRAYKAPEPLLLPFAWAAALAQKDEASAAALLAEAKQQGLAANVLASMHAEHAKVFGTSWRERLERHWALLLGAVAITLALMLVARRAPDRSVAGPPSPQRNES